MVNLHKCIAHASIYNKICHHNTRAFQYFPKYIDSLIGVYTNVSVRFFNDGVNTQWLHKNGVDFLEMSHFGSFDIVGFDTKLKFCKKEGSEFVLQKNLWVMESFWVCIQKHLEYVSSQ